MTFPEKIPVNYQKKQSQTLPSASLAIPGECRHCPLPAKHLHDAYFCHLHAHLDYTDLIKLFCLKVLSNNNAKMGYYQ